MMMTVMIMAIIIMTIITLMMMISPRSDLTVTTPTTQSCKSLRLGSLHKLYKCQYKCMIIQVYIQCPPLCTNLKLLNYKGLLYLHIIKCVIFVDRHHNSFLHFFHIIFTQHFRLKNKIIIIFYIIIFVSKITKNKILLISSSLDKHFVIKISDKNK